MSCVTAVGMAGALSAETPNGIPVPTINKITALDAKRAIGFVDTTGILADAG